ncbi:hypothetical protein PL321_14265 [Caloramator sp. mosi_1]|uniref:hypothetical protein n=1 Tax=Caloramator sp. mosi_1 TaxID=3023090 RepID=UPI00235E3903|nr:hypothetical protein [Caloramator sp. mosi_1]WDC83716.1 hypothetical protein PL321_14265 [Caloramator sp. mosi_1]
MNKIQYISLLAKKFERHFEIEYNKEILGLELDMFAKHYSLNGRTFLTKKDIIDSFENYEYVFVKYYSCLDEYIAENFINFLKETSKEFVKPTKNHMSTYLNGIILFDEVKSNSIDKLIKFKHSKTFLFGIRGWFDTRLLAVNLNGQDIICNREGKGLKRCIKLHLKIKKEGFYEFIVAHFYWHHSFLSSLCDLRCLSYKAVGN